MLQFKGIIAPLTQPQSRSQEYGIKMLRVLHKREQVLVQEMYNTCESEINKNVQEINWINLYLNKRFLFQCDLSPAFDTWVKELVHEVFQDWKEHHIISYGFLFSPAHSTKDQKFHIDYTFTTSNLFIPLTKVTHKNGPQYIQPLHSMPDIFNEYGDIDNILEAEQISSIEIRQIVCKPFCLLQLLPGTIHRGICNSDDYDRIMFWVTVDVKYYELEEKKILQLATIIP